MKITIKKSVLDNMVSNIQSFLEKKDNSQITSHICIETVDGSLILKATDNEIGLKAVTKDVTIIENGSATSNGKKLLDIVRILKEDDELTIESTEDTLTVKQKRSKYKLPTFDATQFPKFPEYEHLPKIGINSLKLMSAFKKITPSIDTNNPKFELNGALLDIKIGGVNVVSTDTKRLSLIQLDEKNKDELSIIIPKKAITEMGKLFFDNIEIFYSPTNLIVKSQHYLFFTKLINGKFPDYHRIIPKEFKVSLALNKEKMVENIRQIGIVSSEIKLTFMKERVIFESLSEDSTEAVSEMECSLSIEQDFSIAFNIRHLQDFLANIDTVDFMMNINEPTTPFEVKSDNFTTIIMPISIN